VIPVHSGCIHSRNAIKHPYRAKTGSTQFQQGAVDSFRRTLMKTLILGFLTSMAMIAGANAASITNKDAQPQVLIVTEAGSKIEMVVEAGATVSFCPAGCFVTMPSGDRETLAGSESIEIINGAAVIK
jgi:hypothetical protein